MVHTRINERSANPNPYINFITVLPSSRRTRDSVEDPEATELLRALAAQLKPVMKAQGLTVNSLEEYESNKVFLGRNWNNGETVELVLRDRSGQFYPISMLLSVFCHELAHIKHMNHSKAFHTLRCQLSAEVAALQRKGYYGDGYWSAGTRLADSRHVSGDAQSVQELPEYTCGGAHTRSRSSALPSRRRRVRARGPSLSTGAQTVQRRKAGSRVNSKTAFEAAGGGNVLDERVEKGGKGSGFGKQARSRRAREERALAAERRLLQMKNEPLPEQKQEQAPHDDGSAASESEDEFPGFDERCAPETDDDRLKMMRDLMGEDLRALRDVYEDDVGLVSDVSGTFTDHSGVKGAESAKGQNDQRHVAGLFETSGSHSTFIGAAYPSSSHEPTRVYDPYNYRPLGDERRHPPREKRSLGSEPEPIEQGREVEGSSGKKRRLESDTGTVTMEKGYGSAVQSSASGPFLGGMVDAEMRQRKREALGMDRGRRLRGEIGVGKAKSRQVSSVTQRTSDDAGPTFSGDFTQRTSVDVSPAKHKVTHEWMCPRCTFANAADRTTCAMCDGMRVWACSMCTFENSGGERCTVCDSPCDA